MTARRLLRWLAALALCSVTAAAWAHKPSDSYLALRVAADGQVAGRWDIALRDLDDALGLDADGDGAITWGELRARHAAIAGYAGARLALQLDGRECRLAVGDQLVDRHTDGAYTVLPLRADCGDTGALQPARLQVQYRLFAELDPQHRGLLRLQWGGAAPVAGDAATLAAVAEADAAVADSAVFSPQRAVQTFDAEAPAPGRAFVQYLVEGVWHIWIGLDHILFLLSLLLPAVLLWQRGAWVPAPRFPAVGWDVLRVVTAFTVAHSITLSAATLGWLTLPSRAVEAVIAASVVVAALNNLRPLFAGRRWLVAFGFGLIHGFGFASVLADLGLPAGALALSLLGFNLGVELGQLAIVAVFLPLAWVLRRTALYRRGLMGGGSLLIALLAAAWFVERAFDVGLLPF